MKIKLAANAKINLNLYITGRQDNGYHTLDTVMQSISLHDVVTVSLNQTKTITVTCSDPALSGEANIVHRAAQMYLDAIHADLRGVNVHIEKHIPLAAGLGGGSADAAAVLIGLNNLFGTPLDLERLKVIALSLGADVPFCLVGGTCRVTGIGERLQTLSPAPQGAVLLIKACQKESTGKMYQKYDEIKGLQRQKTCVIINEMGLNTLQDLCQSLHNDFLPLYEQKVIKTALQLLNQHGAMGTSLSGSGPTVFGVFDDLQKANACALQVRTVFDEVYSASFADCGCQVLI